MQDNSEAREAGRWNFRPQVPLAQNPLFQWPPRPRAIFKWYAAFWLEVSTTTLCFVFALTAYFLILPPLAEMQTLAWGWIAKVWLANLVPQVICAGTLHYWLIMRKRQGDRTKYDPRDQARDNGTYTFGMASPYPVGMMDFWSKESVLYVPVLEVTYRMPGSRRGR